MFIIGMNAQERREIMSAVSQRFTVIDPYLTEQSRRIWAAAEATAIGTHGNAIVAEATGISRTTITKARAECQQATEPPAARNVTQVGDANLWRQRIPRCSPTSTNSSTQIPVGILSRRCAGLVRVRITWRRRCDNRVMRSVNERCTGCCSNWVTRCRAIARPRKGRIILIVTPSFSSSTARCSAFSGRGNR